MTLFSRSSLKVLQRHLEGEEIPARRLSVISYDEVSVEPSITYDQREDRILPSASKCQVVMVRGVLRGFRIPVYVAFDQPMNKEHASNLKFPIYCKIKNG